MLVRRLLGDATRGQMSSGSRMVSQSTHKQQEIILFLFGKEIQCNRSGRWYVSRAFLLCEWPETGPNNGIVDCRCPAVADNSCNGPDVLGYALCADGKHRKEG